VVNGTDKLTAFLLVALRRGTVGKRQRQKTKNNYKRKIAGQARNDDEMQKTTANKIANSKYKPRQLCCHSFVKGVIYCSTRQGFIFCFESFFKLE
jgi:hypothetical protein